MKDLDLRNLPDAPAEAYAAVRQRVMTSVRRQRRTAMAMRATGAAAAVVVMAVGAWITLHHPAPVPPPLLVRNVAPPPSAWERPQPRKARIRKTAPLRRNAPLLAKLHREPLLVTMQTDDPNVVILWLVD